MTSPDGTNWTSRNSATDNNWTSVTYGNGLFVAVSVTGTGNRVMTSPDGTNWTSRNSATDNNWRGVTYGNGLFVAVSATGTGNRVMTSPDGTNWTSRTSATDNNWFSVTYGNGLFVAVSVTGTGNRVMTSPDGTNWTSRTSATDNDWISVTYGNGLFVAVSATGTGNRVMTATSLVTPTIADICFPAGTPITCNQGYIPIEKINPTIHTICKKKIVGITKTITQDKYLVCFEKDALINNIPSQKTIISKNHSIFYKGRMRQAKEFVGINDKVYKIKYSGEVLYNVLMEEHDKMIVNNLICETLHPKNELAKLYTYIQNLNLQEQNELIKKYNEHVIKNKDFKSIKYV
jgi:hypothetical protein